MWKGILMLFALGSGPTDPPLQTTGWGQTYSVQQYGTLEQAYSHCDHDVKGKAAELNAVYAQAEITGPIKSLGRWQGVCVKPQ